MSSAYVPNPEELGRRRFPDNKGFRKNLAAAASDILSLLTSLTPSNYPKDPSTNLSILNNVTARESARLSLSMGAINKDKQWIVSRVRYLQQILGERLFLSDRLAPSNYNDESYRRYLLGIKNAYLIGSKKSDIEAIASAFTGQRVNIKELYLEAREPNSSLDVSSTHKMVVDVLVDNLLRAGQNLQSLIDELSFFINLVRPAHVLYDTRLIWTEQIDVNKIIDVLFGDTGGGCVPVYDYIPFTDTTWLARQVFILNGPEGANGQIDSIHPDDLLFYLSDSTRIITEPGVNGTKVYDIEGRRVTFNALEIGQYVFINYVTIPGNFQFWWMPPDVTDISQFYRDVYRRPAFQEFVKKIMDPQGRFPLQIPSTKTTVCDRWVQDTLQPLYEDVRHQCIGGTHNGTFDSTLNEKMGYPRLSWPYPQDAIYDSKLLGDSYIFNMPYSPLTDGYSHSATINDISVRFDGTSISNAVTYVDSSSSRIEITESDTYWDSSAGRFPIPGDEFTFGYHYLDGTNNIDASSSYVFGISYWQMPQVPIVTVNGNLATTTDMTVSVDGTVIDNAVSSIDPLLGHIVLRSDSDFWTSSILGRLPIAEVSQKDYFTLTPTDISNKYVTLSNFTDGTILILKVDGVLKHEGIDYYVSGNKVKWDGKALEVSLVAGDHLEAIYDTIGDVFKFSYNWGEKYQYSMIFDEPGRIFDAYIDSDSYGMVFDADLDRDPEVSLVIPPTPVEIGYRWRTYLLHHSSVLNSPDTLTLNTYQKPANRASIVNQMDVLNHYNKVFSPEFLYDQNAVDVKHLDDKYLENGLDPVLKLREGTPPFQKTFWSNEGLIVEKKLQDIRKNHRLLMYSDLLMKEFLDSGESVPLNSICDSNNITFKLRMGEDEVNPIKECSPWILFDTVETKEIEISIPGELRSIPNLRMSGIHLRDNFILRDVEEAGTAIFTYTTNSTIPDERIFQLPKSFEYKYQDETYNFPALPIMKDETTLAGINDIQVKFNGVITPGLVKSLDPINGIVELYHTNNYIDEYLTLTAQDILNKEIDLPVPPENSHGVSLSIIHGTAQYIGIDFFIVGQKLIWANGPLDGILTAGDELRVSYIGRTLEFTYRILNTSTFTVADEEWSRIMDDKYVFDGGCPDIEHVSSDARFDEYINFMDDFSSGIKVAFLNTDTNQIEEHVFSGPLFEYYEAGEDQIGSPENFPNALVRIKGPINSGNILNDVVDYGFTGDRAVRFRKKTFQELLPNRTFRTIKLVEMLPI